MMTMPNTSFLSYLVLERGADALHAALAPPLVNLGRALQHLGHGAGNLQEERGRVLDPVVLPSDVPGPGVSAEDAFDGDRIDHQRETLEIHPTNHCEGMVSAVFQGQLGRHIYQTQQAVLGRKKSAPKRKRTSWREDKSSPPGHRWLASKKTGDVPNEESKLGAIPLSYTRA